LPRRWARGGKVLLDPQDILINTTTQPSPPSNGNGTPDVAFADLPDPGTYTVQVSDVTGYSELYLQANRNITVASALAMAAGNSVRFEAGNTIAVNAALSCVGWHHGLMRRASPARRPGPSAPPARPMPTPATSR
jgi:hypothetical protein